LALRDVTSIRWVKGGITNAVLVGPCKNVIPPDTCYTFYRVNGVAGINRIKIGRSHAYPGFSGGRPCLSEREREREHQDDYPKCDAHICREPRAEISRTAEL